MFESVLRLFAVVASLFVLLSYGLFAMDQFSGASARQTAAVETADQVAIPKPEHRKDQARKLIDSGAQILLRPFESLAPAGDAWAQRTLPTLLALFLYGFGLSFLARYARMP